MIDHYFAVIMAGGGGTRLWPLSRRARPKQMLRLGGEQTLFQMAVSRLGGVFPPERILVVTVSEQAKALQLQCPEIPVENFLIEPMPRGTASVVGLAAIALRQRDPEAVMAVLTADHYIENIDIFHQLLTAAEMVAQTGSLVTLGIRPSYAATGYGYVQRGAALGMFGGIQAYEVLRFKEKPNEETAVQFINKGDHDWNSGMFIWRVDVILDRIGKLMPGLYQQLAEIEMAWNQNDHDLVIADTWPRIEPQTIDYGIMEKAEPVAVLPAEGLGWNDVGSWESLFDVLLADENGNILISAQHLGIDTKNSLICADGSDRLIVTIGANDLVIVDTGDALLVCPKSDSQKVREMVNLLKKLDRNEYLQEKILEAYCVKCRTKREINDPVAEFNAAGAPVTRGICGVCGTKMYRIGRTPEHESLTPPEKKKKVPVRSGKLVIVESPAKARTVGRFLGKGYTVKASIGHVRDLLRSELSVDVEDHFKPKYRVPNEKRPIVKELKQLAQKAEEIYLATDPDREGEAIAWHLLESAEIDPKITRRVVFHEITEPAIAEAFSHSRQINMDLVDAQQARRVLDRLVGYSLSPLLWEKVRSRLSAGRVQSVVLRLVVDREREVQSFVPEEYWTIKAELCPEKGKTSFVAKLAKLDDQDPSLPNEEVVNAIVADMQAAEYVVSKLKRSERRRKPSPPYITSSLQQEASRRLGYTAKRTMALAQQLYEGLDVGEGGSAGLITYMRTDSTNVSDVAQNEARKFIKQNYGADFLPETPPQYRTKTKGAQEAHEAIRPTTVMRFPEKIKEYLTRDQFRLYQMIWQRFVASQMESAIYDTLSVEVTGTTEAHQYLLRASGSTVRFAGFLVVYEETQDEDVKSEDSENVRIPADLDEGQKQRLLKLVPEQHFTQPPPRFTEASLVQSLEEYGIGRPSTYAPILSTVLDRGYVVRDAKRLFPTDTGYLVNDLLVEYFPEILDTSFTAHMEEDLDQIADGERNWPDVVGEFYLSFGPSVKRAQEEIPTTKAELEKVGRPCPKCGHDLVIRWGRYGKFISCSNFPECRYTEAWLEKIGVKCPDDSGEIVQRKTRKGRTFYGCSNYPECQFTTWKRPVAVPCPKCGGLLLVANKRELVCNQCGETFLAEKILDAPIETA